jgi:hypothetical protein
VKTILIALIAISLSIVGGAAHAAKLRCDYDRTKDKDKGFERAKNEKGKTRKGFYIDKFTDELVVDTEWESIGDGDTRGMVATRSRGESSYLRLRLIHFWTKKTFPTDEESESNFSIPMGSKMLVGMADGSVLTLSAAETVDAETSYDTPEPRSGDPFVITSAASLEYPIPEAAAAAMAATKTRAFRIVTDSGDLDIRIEGNENDAVVQEAVRCLTEGAT